MSLYNFNEILKIAQARNFKAIGSFNLHCIEMLPAFFKAAQNSNSPLMIQISTGTRSTSLSFAGRRRAFISGQ